MDIELRLREAHAVHDPGAGVTDAVMARVGERSITAPAGGSAVIPLTAARARRRRRFMLVTGAVVIAAAAAMVLRDRNPAALPQVTTAAAPAPALIEEPAQPVVAPAAVPASAPEPVPPPPQVAVVAPDGLPLFLPRPRVITAATQELALQRAVERHPELVEGPETDSLFHMLLVMRRDGSVINSIARLAPPSQSRAVMEELRRLMPSIRTTGAAETVGAASISGARWNKHTALPDGRALRTDVWYELGVFANDFDPARGADRSSQKVEQLVRARYADLLLPSDAPEVNQLTLLLTEDGQIEREKVERVAVAERPNAMPMPELPRTAADTMKLLETMVARQAERVASRLDIAVERIGMIGDLTVRDGMQAVTEDANGNLIPYGQSRQLRVLYAWPRRADESGPSHEFIGAPARFAQGLQQELKESDQRLAPAITIVEQLMPDAFTLPNSEVGTPLVVLTAKGEAVGAMRLNTRGNEQAGSRAISKAAQQLRPGCQLSVSAMETLRNKAGATAQVMFAWLTE